MEHLTEKTAEEIGLWDEFSEKALRSRISAEGLRGMRKLYVGRVNVIKSRAYLDVMCGHPEGGKRLI
jgi:hypothetical protein